MWIAFQAQGGNSGLLVEPEPDGRSVVSIKIVQYGLEPSIGGNVLGYAIWARTDVFGGLAGDVCTWSADFSRT